LAYELGGPREEFGDLPHFVVLEPPGVARRGRAAGVHPAEGADVLEFGHRADEFRYQCGVAERPVRGADLEEYFVDEWDDGLGRAADGEAVTQREPGHGDDDHPFGFVCPGAASALESLRGPQAERVTLTKGDQFVVVVDRSHQNGQSARESVVTSG
jgi:hypothetical protein